MRRVIRKTAFALAVHMVLTVLTALAAIPPQFPTLARFPARIPQTTPQAAATPKETWQVQRVIKDAVLVAYSSTVDQTDSDPFTGAFGRVFLGMVANNCLPKDTVVRIYGWRYRVRDRMHERYDCRWFDIWHPTREAAVKFGVKRNVEIEILTRARNEPR